MVLFKKRDFVEVINELFYSVCITCILSNKIPCVTYQIFAFYILLFPCQNVFRYSKIVN